MAPRAIQTVYDQFNRVVQRRVVDGTMSQVCLLYSAEYFPFTAVSGALTGFVVDAGVVAATDVETANVKGLLKSETFYPAANADGTAPTGGISRTKNYYYDYRGRTVQVSETDSDGWTARYSTKYDFVGNVLATRETHTSPSPASETHYLLTENSYDARGRLLSSTRSYDGTALSPVAYTYDELGRLSTKTFKHAFNTTVTIGTEARNYDIHGWPTDITAKNGGGANTVFSEVMHYASPTKPGTMARHDGNISEITFSTGSATDAGTYGYTYDGLKRLTDAAYYAGTSTSQSLLKTEKDITYDRNGNITGLDRYGAAGLSGMLSFTHAGNRLSSVQAWDGANHPQTDTFTYDAMGNQLTDSRKGLQFSYNFANLPSKVEGMSGSGNAGLTLNYGYLADGTKTSSITNQGEGLKYRGSFVYEIGGTTEQLSSIAWSEGRVALEYGIGGTIPEIRDEWHICDHLGNTRVVVDMTNWGTVVEQNEYLPFGTRIANPVSELTTNRYRLAGKEEQRFGIGAGTLDLHLSDFGARYYDPFTCRWTTRDPLAGKYHSLSPYNYCAGNPVNLVDPFGTEYRRKWRKNTVTVSATIYTSKKDYPVASKAAKYWNNRKGDEYNTDGRKYAVKYNISVEQIEEFVLSGNIGKYNTLTVEPSGSLKNKQGVSLAGSTNSKIGKIRIDEQYAVYKPGTKQPSSTGAHEIGHLLGIEGHQDNTLMSTSQDDKRTMDINSSQIEMIMTSTIGKDDLLTCIKKIFTK